MMLLKNRIINIISYVFVASAIMLLSASFMNTSLSIKTAEMTIFDQACKHDGADYYYANIDIKDENNKAIDTFFRNNYSKNFGGKSTRLLTVSGDDGVVNFKTYYGDMELPFQSAPVSGLYYTNSEEDVMFETVCINLLKYRPKSDETYIDYKIYDGFIYIPDYYADYIIEHNSNINSYDDIFTNSDSNCIFFKYRDRLFKYRIANIFHVNGFNKDYAGDINIKNSDYNNGKKIDYFFNGYCFVSNYDHYTLFDERFHTTLFLQLGPKKYEIEENLTAAQYYSRTNSATFAEAKLYYHNASGTFEYNDSARISNMFFKGVSSKVNIGFLIPGIVLLTSFVVFCFLLFFEKFGLKRTVAFYGISFGIVSLSMLIIFILKKAAWRNITISYLFGPYSSAICIVLMLLIFAMLFLSILKKRAKKCE